ncbi:MAG: hypothetical protein WC683_14130 [bacterium]
MAADGLQWVTPPEQSIRTHLTNWIYARDDDIGALLTRYSAEITRWMKLYAPWTDRTGVARASLIAEYYRISTTTHVLEMRYGPSGNELYYARFLEFAHGGRYAIVGPALSHFFPQIMADVRNTFRRIGGTLPIRAAVTRGPEAPRP